MGPGNVLPQCAYSPGPQDVEPHSARLQVPRKSLGKTEVMELRGPSYDEKCERWFPGTDCADEEPGDPKALGCAHPSECENGPGGCQVRRFLPVNAPILDLGWLIDWYLTIEQLAVGAEGGVGMVDGSNPRRWLAFVFLTRTWNVALTVRAVSILVVDRVPVECRWTARQWVYDTSSQVQ
jgi:hypothetical protein